MPGHVLSAQSMGELIDSGAIFSRNGLISKGRIKPSSLEPTFGEKAFEIPAAFLPDHGRPLYEQIKERVRREIDLTSGGRLEVGSVYVIPLQEGFDFRLTRNIGAKCNPRSRMGRIDSFLRLMADRVMAYDSLPHGYSGDVFVLAIPHSFPLIAHSGDAAVQLRFSEGHPILTDNEIMSSINNSSGLELYGNGTRIYSPEVIIRNGLIISADLKRDYLVGFKARKFEGHREEWPAIDLSNPAVKDDKGSYMHGGHEVTDYFDQIENLRGSDSLTLEPDTFYLLQTFQEIKVPGDLCADIVPIDASLGEYRSHYAGFVDAGFEGTLTLEIRVFSRSELRHEQPVCRTLIERLDRKTEIEYKTGAAHYGQRSPNPGAYFKPFS